MRGGGFAAPALWYMAAMLAVAAPPTAWGNYPGTGAVGSLNELSPAAVSYLRGRKGTVGVAVYNDKTRKTYFWNAGWKVRTASIIKVGIMAAVMNRAQRARRGLTAWEKGRLWAMITQSDNSAADALWANVGSDNVLNYLRSIGMSGLVRDPYMPWAWGYVWAPPADFLKLVSKIRYYQLWSADKHAYALWLMRNVISWEAFLRAGLPAGTNEAEKCGWSDSETPADRGAWRVHTVGAVTAGGSSYTIVIETRYPAGLGRGYGQATIAGIASRIHAAFLKSAATTASKTTVATPSVLFRAMVTADVLNIRTGPGTGYAVVGTLRRGVVVNVYGTSGSWYKIPYGGYYRWIAGWFTRRV